jgi:TatD DNase family protein
MLIDTHAHLDMEEFQQDREEVIDRALKGGITHIITVGIDLASSIKALEIARSHEAVFATVGCHPHDAEDLTPADLEEMEALASQAEVVAWGEVGLDFYRRYSPPDKQTEVFERQIDMALHLDLPLIIHDRDAHQEVRSTLLKKQRGEYKGVLHCFSGDYELAMSFIDMGFFISIPGTVTYKKALETQQVASRIPLDRMLIETDAPFLAPVPRRGKRNEPLLVRHTAQKIADLRGMDIEELGSRTSRNARDLFGLPER